jgi:hypothetical protein
MIPTISQLQFKNDVGAIKDDCSKKYGLLCILAMKIEKDASLKVRI